MCRLVQRLVLRPIDEGEGGLHCDSVSDMSLWTVCSAADVLSGCVWVCCNLRRRCSLEESLIVWCCRQFNEIRRRMSLKSQESSPHCRMNAGGPERVPVINVVFFWSGIEKYLSTWRWMEFDLSGAWVNCHAKVNISEVHLWNRSSWIDRQIEAVRHSSHTAHSERRLTSTILFMSVQQHRTVVRRTVPSVELWAVIVIRRNTRDRSSHQTRCGSAHLLCLTNRPLHIQLLLSFLHFCLSSSFSLSFHSFNYCTDILINILLTYLLTNWFSYLQSS